MVSKMASYRFICIASALVVSICRFGNSLTLDENGGYSIVVAVEPSTPEPPNLANYMQRLQATLQSFSTKLYISTNETFFLRRVDLLLPPAWNSDSSESITASYDSADIRVTNALTSPFVENSNLCGLPGSFVELPLRFLDQSQADLPYGDPAKALLNPWARFRYGVWEEHGDPGTSKHFPYFYKDFEKKSWEVTTCSDVPLVGDKTDNDGETCGDDWETSPSKDCRFRPANNGNTAESSLMGFHFLDSITQFCNDDNHNFEAQNRQNTFCDYKSIWSVITSSEDFGKVTAKLPSVPAVEHYVFKARTKPALYLLIDRGAFTANDQAGNIVIGLIKTLPEFFEKDMPEGTAVSVGSFASDSSDETVKNLVPWSTLPGNLEAILDAIGSVEINPNQGDFAGAISKAAGQIEKLNPMGGSVLLVIKIGNGAGFFYNPYYEEDLLLKLNKNRIAVFAAEVQNTNDDLNTHLANMAAKTGGKHVSLKTVSSVPTEMEELLTSVVSKLADPVTSSHEVLVYKNTNLQKSQGATVPLPFGLMDIQMKLTLTYIPRIYVDNRQVGFQSDPEWTENGKRHVITIAAEDLTELGEELVFRFDCPGMLCPTAPGFLTVSGTLPEQVEDITVEVSTSAVNGEVDLNNLASELAPFVVYAKIEKGGKPLVGLTVTADINGPGGRTLVKLLDNGNGIPDVSSSDGIFSAVFIPTTDGAYQISISVQTNQRAAGNANINGFGSRLLPVDQGEIGQKEPAELNTRYSGVFDYNGEIVFLNAENFPKASQPMKILDVYAAVQENDQTTVRISFTAPSLLSGQGKPTKYQILGAVLRRSLRDEVEEDIIQVVEEDASAEPGETETFEFLHSSDDVIYYQVRAVHEGTTVTSQTSNIVQLASEVEEEEESTTEVQSTETTESTGTETTESVGTETTESGSTDTTESAGIETTESGSTEKTESAGTETTESGSTEATESGSTEKTEPASTQTTESAGTETTEPAGTETTKSAGTDSTDKSPESTAEPTSSTTNEPDTDKPFFETAGGIVVIIVIVLLVLGAAGGGYWYYRKRQAKQDFDRVRLSV